MLTVLPIAAGGVGDPARDGALTGASSFQVLEGTLSHVRIASTSV
jgi:hypothetical protein